eukprot:3657832-Pleurochrysis_carterae.AAC.1
MSRERPEASFVYFALFAFLSSEVCARSFTVNHRLTNRKTQRGRKKAGSQRQCSQTARRGQTVPVVSTIPVPNYWFLDPLRAEMRIRVRPPMQRTRRRLVEVKDMPLPRGCFEEFLAPLKDGEAAGLTRNESSGLLQPTKRTATTGRFEYTLVRPMVTDRLFQLELANLKKGPNKATRAKGAWRRGSGCARLVLPRGGCASHGPHGTEDEHGRWPSPHPLQGAAT